MYTGVQKGGMMRLILLMSAVFGCRSETKPIEEVEDDQVTLDADGDMTVMTTMPTFIPERKSCAMVWTTIVMVTSTKKYKISFTSILMATALEMRAILKWLVILRRGMCPTATTVTTKMPTLFRVR